MRNIREFFGNIDIYIFDQILKGRFSPGMKILDAGTGGGRNIIYFLREGLDVFAVDRNAEAIGQIKQIAEILAPDLPEENFQVAPIEKLPFPDSHFDWVIGNAVLHFAEDQMHFDKMLGEMWRVLKPEGIFFARLASTIGIEDKIIPTANGRYDLPDGSERFLVDEDLLLSKTEELGGALLEPIKTTNVRNLRCMTTWVMRKN
jgi:SAM-dependent methyltransferase